MPQRGQLGPEEAGNAMRMPAANDANENRHRGVIAKSSQNRTLRAVGALTSSSSHDLDCQLLA